MAMSGEVWDYPTRIRVSSEDDPEDSYLVDLCAYEVGLNEQGLMQFNGSCQCKNFIFVCEPRLKKPENMGRMFRCKHIRWAREHALDFILPRMKELDPNTPEDHQP